MALLSRDPSAVERAAAVVAAAECSDSSLSAVGSPAEQADRNHSEVVAVADTAEVDPLYDNMAGLKKKAELILLPTTCGTGSEVTCIAVLNRTRIGTKMGLQAEALYADEAIMIPELLSGLLPAEACTSDTPDS